jgi:hypothetical protein
MATHKAMRRFAFAVMFFICAGTLGVGGSVAAMAQTAEMISANQQVLGRGYARENEGLAVADYSNGRVLIYNTPSRTDENASIVLGKANFQSQGYYPGCGEPSANTMCNPTGVGKDLQGNLYVVDGGNCRILQFRQPFTSGMNASVVFSGLNIGGSASDCFLSTSGYLAGLQTVVGPHGTLWVADDKDSQVVGYVPPFSNGMTPTVAIGQTSVGILQTINNQPCNQGGVNQGDGAPTASTLCHPLGVAMDPLGNLWVSDSQNNRVLKYKPPFSTGMAAILELGHPASAPFTSGTVSGLSEPAGLAFDSNGNLWVAVEGNNQVVEYVPPFRNGKAESVILYGDSLTSAFNGPTGVTFDSKGRLSVSDSGNNRVLTFDPPFHSGMSAATVLGQPNFTDVLFNQGGGTTSSAKTLGDPRGIVAF